MEENSNSIAKITEMLSNIEERLQELNSEREELAAYQQLDRERRAAQYGLYSLELQKARSQLDQVEHDHLAHVEAVSTLHEAAKETHDAIRHTEAVLKTKGSQLLRTRQTVSSLEDDKKQAVTVYTKLDLECKELDESVIAGDELATSNQQKLAELEREIAKVEQELAYTVLPTYDQAVTTMQGMTDQRESAVKETEALYAKQGRGRMFRTVQERDACLMQNRRELEAAQQVKETELVNQRDTLANLRRTVEKEAADIKLLQQVITKTAAGQQSLSKSIDEKGRQRLDLNDNRRENWRKTEELQEQVREARDVMHSCLSDTRKVMPRATAMGLEALRSIVEQEGLVHGEQYFGMLLENMQLTDVKY
jgi:structural maintenance of chromosome 3 (chondroitin sulfate proteoglycan 6)